MRRTVWFFTVAICLSLRTSIARGAGEVGRLGDLTAIRIEGAKLIPVELVREALLKDMESQTAASPSAPLTDFLNTMQRRLLVGYEGSGFPRAKVSVDPDRSGTGILVRVEEGPRYKAGAVQVVGAKLAEVALIQKALTDRSPAEVSPAQIDSAKQTIVIPTWQAPDDPKEPSWEIGKPAPLDEWRRRELSARVLESLVKQGLCWATVKVEPSLGDDGVAALVVTLVNEGPRAVADDIQIVGLKVNKSQDVIKFLGLEKGMPVDLSALRRMREKLWESGRFLRHQITADVAQSHPGKVKITIDIAEHAKAAPLGVEAPATNPAEAGMRRLSQTLRKTVDGEDALVATFDSDRHHVKVVFQNGRGIVVRVRRDGFPAKSPSTGPTTSPATNPALQAIYGFGSEPLDLTWASTADRLDLLSTLANRRYLTGSSKFQVQAKIDCIPELDPTTSHTVNFTVGAGIHPVNDLHAPGVVLECTLAPVFFFDLAASARDGAKGTLETRDGVTTLTRGSLIARTEAATGKLIEISYTDRDASFRLTVNHSAFDDELTAIAKQASARNDYDARRPVSSLVGFVSAWYAACPVYDVDADVKRRVAGQTVLAKLLARQILAPLDEAVSAPDDQTEEFQLPADPKYMAAALGSNPLALFRVDLFAWDKLFPYGSWPWTVGHEGTLLATGGSATAHDELRRLMSSDEIGPVGCLAVSRAIRSINPGLSRGVAKIGMERLDAAEFAKDFHVLLENDRAGAKVLHNLLQGVSELSEQELTDLGGLLPASAVEPLRFVWKLGHEHPGKTITELLAARQKEWWDKELRRSVEEELRNLDRD